MESGVTLYLFTSSQQSGIEHQAREAGISEPVDEWMDRRMDG